MSLQDLSRTGSPPVVPEMTLTVTQICILSRVFVLTSIYLSTLILLIHDTMFLLKINLCM